MQDQAKEDYVPGQHNVRKVLIHLTWASWRELVESLLSCVGMKRLAKTNEAIRQNWYATYQ
jgi:hypothetical protein